MTTDSFQQASAGEQGCKHSQFSTFDRMHITETLYTNIVLSLFIVFFQFVHRQTQLSCTLHSLTSVCAYLTWIK